MSARAAMQVLAVALVLMFAASCGPSLAGFSLKKLRAHHKDLPDDPEALKQSAAAQFVDAGPLETVNASLRSACKAVYVAPKDGEASFLTCQACFWLMEYGETPVCYNPKRNRLKVVHCSDHCRDAVRRDRDNPLYTYLLGVTMGLELKRAFITSKIMNISSLIDTLERAVELDSTVDSGGPLRVLGTLYLRAPPWPRGLGDGEKALELLEQAVEEHPGHPLNHLFYAEALLDDEEYEDALEQIQDARARVDPAALSWRAERYLGMIDKLEMKIRTTIP